MQRQFEEVGLAGPRQGQQGGAVLGAGADGGVPPPPPAMGGAQGAPWGQSQPAYGLQRPPPVPAQYQQQPLVSAPEPSRVEAFEFRAACLTTAHCWVSVFLVAGMLYLKGDIHTNGEAVNNPRFYFVSNGSR